MPREGTEGPQRGLAGMSAPPTLRPPPWMFTLQTGTRHLLGARHRTRHWGHQGTEQVEAPVFFSRETGKEHAYKV